MKYTTYIKPAHARTAFFPSHKIRIDKWSLLRKLALDFDFNVQLRLEWIIFYETVGNKDATYTSKYFNTSRKTFHKWYRRFTNSRNKINSLCDISKAPLNKRQWQVSKVEEERIVILRKAHMLYGKKKLKRLYWRFYKEVISTWKIERVIRKHKLYPDPVKNKLIQVKRARNKAKPRIRINTIQKIETIGTLWHIDSIILYFDNLRRAIITGIDEVSKIAYAKMYPSNNSKNTKDFIQRLLYLTEGNISVIHTDNGSEFDGYFAEAVEELNIPRVYSRPHTPKDNPVNERFNRTIQTDWLEGALFDPYNLKEANQLMTEWLIEYNTFRPHESLDQLTPLEYVEANLQVLPMYPARTWLAPISTEGVISPQSGKTKSIG